MVSFNGWEMPVQYSGIGQEHLAVRSGVGIFDVCHMGQLQISGYGSVSFLQHLLPVDAGRIRIGALKYAVMCNEQGGAVDDLAVYRLGETEFMLVVNAGRTDADLEWIRNAARDTEVCIEDRSEDTGMVAIQGPEAEAVTSAIAGPRSSRSGGIFNSRGSLSPGAISSSAAAGIPEKTALKSCALMLSPLSCGALPEASGPHLRASEPGIPCAQRWGTVCTATS